VGLEQVSVRSRAGVGRVRRFKNEMLKLKKKIIYSFKNRKQFFEN
jgi:hypothetical protein